MNRYTIKYTCQSDRNNFVLLVEDATCYEAILALARRIAGNNGLKHVQIFFLDGASAIIPNQPEEQPTMSKLESEHTVMVCYDDKKWVITVKHLTRTLQEIGWFIKRGSGVDTLIPPPLLRNDPDDQYDDLWSMTYHDGILSSDNVFDGESGVTDEDETGPQFRYDAANGEWNIPSGVIPAGVLGAVDPGPSEE